MLEVTNPRCHTITVMSCTQLMKTSLLNNIVGYFIHQDPAPIILAQPIKELAETWSKERFDKMIRDTPVLFERVTVKRKGDSENTIWNKTFPGGQLNIVTAGSPSQLASRPIRVVLCDEIDKYPKSAGKEGDPIKLLEERCDTFWNALKVRVCSPTIEGDSRIYEEWEKGDQRSYHGKCPHCGEYEDLRWEQVMYPKDWQRVEDVKEDDVNYECSHCGVLWTERDRLTAISEGNGKYIAKKPFNGHASFKANKIASPWKPLSDLVKKYLSARNSSEELKTFYNTQLTETYKIKADSPDHMRLYERRELYDINTIPDDVLFLTAGVDVQGNRLEFEVVGWCADKQSYSIDYRVIPGNTATPEPWKELQKVLNEKWRNSRGVDFELRMMTVDTGFNTQHVYNWLRKQDINRVRGVKGADNCNLIFGRPSDVELNHNGERIKNVTKIWIIGVNIVKGELYSWLKLDVPTPGSDATGYCHFPQYDESYFEGLCSEQLVEVTDKNGKTSYVWQKKIARNEPLDTRVYARVGASMLGLDRYTKEELIEMFDVNGVYVTNNDNNDTDEGESNDFWNDSSERGSNSKRRGIW